MSCREITSGSNPLGGLTSTGIRMNYYSYSSNVRVTCLVGALLVGMVSLVSSPAVKSFLIRKNLILPIHQPSGDALGTFIGGAWMPLFAGGSSSPGRKNHYKVDQLYQRTRKRPGQESAVIRLSSRDYHEYVLSEHRPYHLIILYTTQDPSFCRECTSFNAEYIRIAKEYYRDATNQQQQSSGKRNSQGSGVKRVGAGLGNDKLPLFFCLYEVGQDRAVVNLHRLNTIPLLVSLTSRTFPKLPTKGDDDIFIPFRKDDTYQVLGQGFMGSSPRGGGAKSFAVKGMDWINMKTGRKVVFEPTYPEKLQRLLLLATLLGIFALLLFAAVRVVNSYPSSLILGALVVQYVSTTGLFYNLQHGMTWAGYDPNTRQRLTINSQHRAQYLGEGLAMAAAYLLGGLALFAATRLPTYWPHLRLFRFLAAKSETVTSKGSQSRGKNIVRNSVTKRPSSNPIQLNEKHRLVNNVLVLLFALLFILFLTCLFKVYIYKSPWYSPSFFPPPGYIKGRIRLDRGNAF